MKKFPSSIGLAASASATLAVAITAMQQQGLMDDLQSLPYGSNATGNISDYESGISSSSSTLADILYILLNESNSSEVIGGLPSGGGRRARHLAAAPQQQKQQLVPLAVNDPLYRNGSQWFHARVQNMRMLGIMDGIRVVGSESLDEPTLILQSILL